MSVINHLLIAPPLCRRCNPVTDGFKKTSHLLTAILFLLFSIQAFAQTTPTFPPASSCTSKDLTLVSATLPGTGLCNNCPMGDSVYRTLNLSINNKTGSTRTSFAFWGTLVIRNSNGTTSSTRAIQGCGGPVAKNTITTLLFNQIGYVCGQSLTIKDLFLAWTDASPGSTCASINSATINPKCGTLDSIRINTGLDASFSVTNATCNPGAIDMTPLGGKSPYTYSWTTSDGVIPAGQSTHEDLTGLVAGTYTVTITDALGCPSTRSATVSAVAPVVANAGSAFTITCTDNNTGTTHIGETAESGFTYSWSPATGLSATNISDPIATPSTTTTYTVTKTKTSTGCSNTANVTVTVDNAAVVVNAGSDFSKTCTSNTGGKQIGEASADGFTYSWSPAAGLNFANISNPTANPSSTTTYTVTKTKTSSGCYNTDAVTVTVDNDAVVVNAGNDFTKTCTANTTGLQIGEASAEGYTYSWSPATGLSAANVSNPTANPSSTTTYTVTKTKTSSGCFNTDAVTVTVDNDAVVANAGNDFTKTCTANTTGLQIGEASADGYTYSWSPATGLSAANISNPTANPSSTTTYTVTKTKTSSGCYNTDAVTVTVDNDAVVANAGNDFTKTCTANTTGLQIGEASAEGYTYSWSPATGLSAANVSNPTANPSSTTTYTVTKTKTSSGCFNTDAVTVTVDNDAVVANAGNDFTKTCTANTTGLQIGEASADGYTYSWSPATGLSAANVSNPTANPTSTTTYTVTKTKTSSGCFNTDAVTVTVDNAAVVANAGNDFTKTCTANTTGLQIGETSTEGYTYSWSPATGLSAANVSNPTANPASTTTYTVTKTKTSSGCYNTDNVTVTVNTNAPAAPTFCAVQPSLCGPATGSITIKSPLGADYQYSIDNGTTWQSGVLFDNLAAGSVTGIKVKKLSSGCISSAVLCDASDCSQSARLVTNSTENNAQTLNNTLKELTIKALPNPFTNNVKFVVNAPEAGTGSLEIFNMLGQKVRTVFQGHIQPGGNNFEVSLPSLKSAQLIYVLRVGNKTVTGKLLQLNQ